MNISRLMLQNTACRASAVSAIHNRHVSSLNRCPSVTNLLCQVRIHVVAPANVILKVAIFFLADLLLKIISPEQQKMKTFQIQV